MNSTPKIVNCLKESIRLSGLPRLPESKLSYVIGLGLPEAIKTLYPNIDESNEQVLRQHFRQQFLFDDDTMARPFDGVADMLADLSNQGYFLALATGKGRLGLEKALSETELGGFFAVSRCADESASKPDPLMLYEILADLGMTGDDALMVGDTKFDLQMAQAAGVDCVGVKHGAHSQEMLARCQPLTILDHVTHLVSWLGYNV